MASHFLESILWFIGCLVGEMEAAVTSKTEHLLNGNDIGKPSSKGGTIRLSNLGSRSSAVAAIEPLNSNSDFKVDSKSQLYLPSKPLLEVKKESWFAFMSPSWKGWEVGPSKVIRSFNIIKAIFIFMLIPYHITVVARIVPERPSYASFYLPYPTTYHGLEFMMGLLFISGWLSHATTKPGITFSELMKKKLLRLLPAYYIGGVVFAWVCIVWEAATGNLNGPSGTLGVGIQFVLECLTLGSWNPALLWWTRNRPLWFISTLLCYYYFSPIFLPWVRGLKSTYTVFALMMGMVVLRMTLGFTIYSSLTLIYPHNYQHYPRIAHLWSVTQIFLPFIGCTLCEFSNRIGRLTWHRNTIWRVTDAVTLFTICMATFLITPPVWNAQFDNETGLFINESKNAYYYGSLCAFSQFMVWPMMLTAIYLYSHDQSTLTWIYTCYPRFFEAGVAASFPLFLTNWPILLILQKTKTFNDQSGVSVLMLFCVCLSTSLVYDNFVIQPLEERIVAYFNPPKAGAGGPRPTAAASPVAKPALSLTIKEDLQKKLQLQLDDVKLKDEIIKTLDTKVAAMQEEIDSLRRDRRTMMDPKRRSLSIMGLLYASRESGYSHHIRPTWDLDEEEVTALIFDENEENENENENELKFDNSDNL